MKRKTAVFVASVWLIVTPLGQISADQEGGSEPESRVIGERILNKAKEYLGLDSVEGVAFDEPGEPELVIDEADKTPFMHHNFQGRKVWRVTFGRVEVNGAMDSCDDPYAEVRDFDVFIDPSSEKLLKIVSTREQGERLYTPLGTAEEREATYRKAGTTFAGLPDSMPVPLIEVLAQSPHSPYCATEIEAVYVLHEHADLGAHRRWVITLLGIPPIVAFGPGGDDVPMEQRASVTIVAEASTGEILGAVVPAY